MISIPGVASNSDPQALIDDEINNPNCQVLLPFYSWNPTNFTYEPVNELKQGEGYWCLSLNPDGEILTIPLVKDKPQNNFIRTIEIGWSMIGSLWNPTNFSNRNEDPDGSLIGSPYWWNPSTFSYESTGVLEPGRGYWILSPFQSTQLEVHQAIPNESSMETAAAPVGLVSPQPFTLALEIVSDQEMERVVLGLHSQASIGFDVYDSVKPPVSPQPKSLNAYFHANQIEKDRQFQLQLQKQILPWATDGLWNLKIESLKPAQVQWSSQDLPEGLTILVLLGGTETNLSQQNQLSLPAGKHQLRFRVEFAPAIPMVTRLLQNYPNPFNPETWIPFQLKEANQVYLTIYDSRGQVIRTIDLGFRKAGIYRSKETAIYWNGRNQVGELVANGIYFYRLEAGDYQEIRKMTILK